jgi:hypothetical protein
MANQERCKEVTTEQLFQEDLLENAYRTSGNPNFVKRAEFMMDRFQIEESKRRIEMKPGQEYPVRA